MIWTCNCGGEGVAFYPGSDPEIILPLGIVVSRGEPGRVLCLPHAQERGWLTRDASTPSVNS